jgi:hypothetical protein
LEGRLRVLRLDGSRSRQLRRTAELNGVSRRRREVQRT